MGIKIQDYKDRIKKLDEELLKPEIFGDPKKASELSKELARLQKVIALDERSEKIKQEIKESEKIMLEREDEELLSYAKNELIKLQKELETIREKLKKFLAKEEEQDDRNVILEIRAGTGGNEAAFFAADLYRMYIKFSESQGWIVEQLNSNKTETGGIKEVSALITGKNAFGYLKFESGVHRVQRVPVTESAGRIHTSTATVAVLPEQVEIEIKIKSEDLKIDVYRARGPGGQSVNTTDSAVRITHIPTGAVVTCQDQKSQLKNKEAALKILKSRLYEMQQEKAAKKMGEKRKTQIGTGERAEKIRTYNFPQDRITDHRIKKNWHNVPKVLNGHLSEIVEELQKAQHKLQHEQNDKRSAD